MQILLQITKLFLEELSIYLLYLLMYIISVMILNFSIRDFGHPKFLKSQFGHPVERYGEYFGPLSIHCTHSDTF